MASFLSATEMFRFDSLAISCKTSRIGIVMKTWKKFHGVIVKVVVESLVEVGLMGDVRHPSTIVCSTSRKSY